MVTYETKKLQKVFLIQGRGTGLKVTKLFLVKGWITKIQKSKDKKIMTVKWWKTKGARELKSQN